jgi:hypothetical protein
MRINNIMAVPANQQEMARGAVALQEGGPVPRRKRHHLTYKSVTYT